LQPRKVACIEIQQNRMLNIQFSFAWILFVPPPSPPLARNSALVLVRQFPGSP
jgi:hypothetical protein